MLVCSYLIMSVNPQPYIKQNSFIGVRHREDLKDILPRFHEIRSRLESEKLSSYQKTIVRDAIDEVLEETLPPDGNPPFALQSYNVEEISRLSNEDLPRYIFYRYRYDTFPKRKRLDSFPPCLQIEPASVCNYRCLFCYQIDEEFTTKSNGMMGMMSLSLFKRIIDQAEGQCEAITLASRGEPLICPDIEAMLRYARGKFLALKLNTNAWFLDEKLCHAILESGVNTIVFSADAATEPAYSAFRVNGNLERVHENIKRFHHIRERHYSESRTISRVCGVKVPGADTLETMEKFWGELVDQVAFVKYNPWENSYDQPVNDISESCSDLWRRMFIWWDGKVNPCDVDYKSKLKIGSASEGDLAEIWQSGKYTHLRESHLTGRRCKEFPCNRCSVV